MVLKIFLFFLIFLTFYINVAISGQCTTVSYRVVTKKCSGSALDYNRTINVRTVLFTKADSSKVCWSPEEANLLIARRLMQDLIPKRIPKDFKALLEYINTCINVVKTKTTGKVSQTMLKGLYDALGGYLHSVVVPILNEAYYAGNVDYQITSQIHYMLGMMMSYLGTNGATWAYPCDMSKIPVKVSSLPLRMCSGEDACRYFVILERNPAITDTDPSTSSSSVYPGGLKIQIPFLDDNAYPSAIAVPLKDHALFSLMSECSVNIIPKYYIMAMRCLGSANYARRDIINFNHQLHQWIISVVVPHLHELDRWYPGFGGIMRVVETMNRRGLASHEPIKPNVKTSDVMPDCFGKESCKASWFSSSLHAEAFPVLMLILTVAFGAFILVLAFCLLRCLCTRITRKKLFSSGDDDVNAMVSLYCGLREPSRQADVSGKSETTASKTFGTSTYTSSSGGT